MLDFECDDNAFKLEDSQKIGGSTTSMGMFLDPRTGERWLGKSEIGRHEEDSRFLACREKLANSIYGYYGIHVARLSISRQALSIQDETIKQSYFDGTATGTSIKQAYHVMSRWIDRFQSYGYLPKFERRGNEDKFTLLVEGYEIVEQGLGCILAVAHWLNDIDVLNPQGQNVGYQLQLDGKGQLYVVSCKIDPGNAFANFSDQVNTSQVKSKKIQVSTINDFIEFDDLPKQTKQEYLATFKKINDTSEKKIKSFLQGKAAQFLEDVKVRNRDDYASLDAIYKTLIARRQALVALHQQDLNQLSQSNPSAIVIPRASNIPAYIERLYCQAKFMAETEVKEKAAFYIPMDVRIAPRSEQRLSMNAEINNFLLALDKKILLLLGESGSGKSIATQLLVKRLWAAYEMASIQERNQKAFIPIRVELKQFGVRTIGQCIINTLLDEYRYEASELKQLQQHRFLFILDGYDEIGGQTQVNLIQSHMATENLYGKWKEVKFIITCRDRYFQDLAADLFYSSERSRGELKILYLCHLTKEAQVDYLIKYKESQPQKKMPNYVALFEQDSKLSELLGNPFLLRIFRDAYPVWMQKYPQRSFADLTRYELYTSFMDQWFENEKLRISVRHGNLLGGGFEEKFLTKSKELAMTMHERKVDELDVEKEESEVWKTFFSSQDPDISDIRAACPLRRSGRNRYSFVHKSFLEYFVARFLWDNVNAEKFDEKSWNKRLLPETPEIINFISDKLINADFEIKERLVDCVQHSRTTSEISVAAANAITLLNAAGIAFAGKYGDLAGIKIPGADLAGGILDHACLHKADLRGVNFTHAILRFADLRGADLRGASFGETAPLEFKGEINTISYSFDGKYLAVAVNNNVELWNAAGDQQYAILKGHAQLIKCLNFSRDNTCLASFSDDGVINVWSVNNRKILAIIKIELQQGYIKLQQGYIELQQRYSYNVDTPMYAIAFSLDSKTLLLCVDEECSFWSIENKKKMMKLDDSAYGIAFSSDGKMVATCDGTWLSDINFWSVSTYKLLEQIPHDSLLLPHDAVRISRLAFSPNGKLIAAVTGTRVFLVLLENKKVIARLENEIHKERITCLKISTDNKYLAIGCSDGSVRLWDIENQQKIANLAGHLAGITSVDFSSDSTSLISSSIDGTVRLWKLEEINRAYVDYRRNDIVWHDRRLDEISRLHRQLSGYKFAYSHNRKFNVEISSTDVLIYRDGVLFSSRRRLMGSIYKLCISNDGEVACVGDSEIRFFTELKVELYSALEATVLKKIDFSPDGNLLVFIDNQSVLHLWSIENRKHVDIDNYKGARFNTFNFSSKGSYLALATKIIKLWSITQQQEIAILNDNTDIDINSVSFKWDEQQLAAGSEDGRICIWSISTSQCIQTLKVHTSRIVDISFNAEGELASLARDGTIFLWKQLYDVLDAPYQIIDRHTNCSKLHVAGAFFKDAQLSPQNLALLKQLGADDKIEPVDTIKYQVNRNAFFNNPAGKASFSLEEAVKTAKVTSLLECYGSNNSNASDVSSITTFLN